MPTAIYCRIFRKGPQIPDGKWKLCYHENDSQTQRLNLFFELTACSRSWIRFSDAFRVSHDRAIRPSFHPTLLTWLAQLCDVFGSLRGEFVSASSFKLIIFYLNRTRKSR